MRHSWFFGWLAFWVTGLVFACVIWWGMKSTAESEVWDNYPNTIKPMVEGKK